MPRLAALLFLLQALSAFSAQLDLVILQFPEVKTIAELDAELAGVNLAEITNADRTVTSVPALKGAYVLFAQSISDTASLRSSTRLGNFRSDVDGSLKGNRLQVEIRLSEGVDAGLRRFSSRIYSGSAALQAGSPKVVSLRVITGKTNSVTKGNSEVKETTSCHAIIAQLR